MKKQVLLTFNDKTYLVPEDQEEMAVIKLLCCLRLVTSSGYGEDRKRTVESIGSVTIEMEFAPAGSVTEFKEDPDKAEAA